MGMAITIENPTAEDAFQALQSLPKDELARLKMMFLEKNTPKDDEEAAWRQASAQSASQFFEDEEA